MLQANEIKQRFSRIERTIQTASQACRSDSSAPLELKEAVRQLDLESDQVKQVMQSHDESRIRQAVDSLEQMGDRAEQACQKAGKVDDQTKRAIHQVHTELSDLKKQLH